MILGAEFRAGSQLGMMQRQISLWQNLFEQNPDLLKTMDHNDRAQVSYMLTVLKDHLSALQMRIVS